MKLSIFTTYSEPKLRGDMYVEPLTCYNDLADEVIVVDGGYIRAQIPGGYDKKIDNVWPKEFDWPFIGEQFQRGYEACTGDWAIHMDCDWIFHENDYDTIRKACETDAPALTFWKYQMFTMHRYNLKSRLVLAVNKKKYGDRIKFNSGGDLCQPSLDGVYIDPLSVPEAKVPIWNYECLLKTKKQLLEDKGRMARAWQRHFGEYKLGGPDDESAYDVWWGMIKGRYKNHTNKLELKDHPAVMQETLKNLRPEQFGFNMFGYADA